MWNDNNRVYGKQQATTFGKELTKRGESLVNTVLVPVSKTWQGYIIKGHVQEISDFAAWHGIFQN